MDGETGRKKAEKTEEGGKEMRDKRRKISTSGKRKFVKKKAKDNKR